MRVKRSVGAVGDSKHACLAWMYAVASEAVHARVSEDVVVGLGVCNDAQILRSVVFGSRYRLVHCMGDRGLG